MKQVRPYSALAQVYDLVMAHVDYEGWADYLVHLVEMHFEDADQLEVLELGAGSGLLTEELLELVEWRITISDGSADMLAAAGNRLGNRVQQGKVIDFGRSWAGLLDKEFDLIFLLYDGFNYLLEAESARRLFEGVSARLTPGGRFLFDQSTPWNSINNEAFFEDEGEEDGLKYRRTSAYDREAAFHTTTFDIQTRAGRFHEEHQQRAWTRAEALAMVGEHDLEVVAAYDGFSLDPAHDESERIHWVIRRR